MTNSYILYFSTILLTTLFAGLAQKYKKINKKGNTVPNNFFWGISMLILIFIMGFRLQSVGVDDYTYLNDYNLANSMDIFSYYKNNVTEPAFYLLYRIIHFIFNDFQWLIIITSAITIFCFYRALSYEIKNISLMLAVFIFSTTQYFYYFGIIRMGIAVAIISIAYRYLIENKKKQYLCMVLLASSFHYSALILLILVFINIEKIKEIKRSTVFKIICIIPLVFLCIRFFIYPFITASKYQAYINSVGFFSLGVITSLPFLILFLINFEKLKTNKNYSFYLFLFIIAIAVDLFAPIISIGRVVWYINISLCILLPAVIRLEKKIIIKMLILLLLIAYCNVYLYYSYFGDSYRGEFMLPYKNVYFNLQ